MQSDCALKFRYEADVICFSTGAMKTTIITLRNDGQWRTKRMERFVSSAISALALFAENVI